MAAAAFVKIVVTPKEPKLQTQYNIEIENLLWGSATFCGRADLSPISSTPLSNQQKSQVAALLYIAQNKSVLTHAFLLGTSQVTTNEGPTRKT